ncbi:MAG: LytTR family transcriptional regulator DNA-binding domain-containing protein [Bacteroidales bacterium]|nr:LytTR family transcriptional regulator DNA-binding domain-containing protein [Bacteroidales bacterium]
MIRCIIIDDEAPARNIIKTFLADFDFIEIVAECDNGFDGFKMINDLNPDFIFLDIQMPKLTGFEMLEILDKKPIIIFSTSYDQFAIKAFEHNALDYLLKPFSKDRFRDTIKKVEQKILSNETQTQPIDELVTEVQGKIEKLDRVVVKSGTKISIISIESLIHVSAEDDYVMLHTTSGRFLKQLTMNYLENHLPNESFLRVHRSSIINITYIDKMERYEKETYMIILKNGEKVKTSKTGAKLLKEKLHF